MIPLTLSAKSASLNGLAVITIVSPIQRLRVSLSKKVRKQVLPVLTSLPREIEASGKVPMELVSFGNLRMKSIITNVTRSSQNQEDGGNTLLISMTPNSLQYQERARRRTKRIDGRGHRRLIPSRRNNRRRRESHPNGKRANLRCRTALSLETSVTQSFQRMRRADYMEIVREWSTTKISRRLTAQIGSSSLQPQVISLIINFSLLL